MKNKKLIEIIKEDEKLMKFIFDNYYGKIPRHLWVRSLETVINSRQNALERLAKC